MSKEGSKYTFIDYLYMLVKHRWLIVINGLIFCLIASVYSLFMPKTFTSHVTIMPPEGGGPSGMISQMAAANLPISGGLRGLLGGSTGEVSSYLAILKSRNMGEKVIDQFDLIERYGSENIDAALVSFGESVSIELTEEGTVRITTSASTEFWHREENERETRQLTADMANFMASELDRINTQLRTEQARTFRKFIERRYNQNKQDLRRLEKEMKAFEEKYGVISLEDQVRSAIESAAKLKTEIVMSEIQLEALRSTLGEDHPSLVQQRIRLRELRKNLNQLKTGTEDNADFEIFPPFSKAPDIGIEFMRLKRKLEVQKVIYEFLTQQYEQAKLQEAKDTPTVQVIDKAVAPILRQKPKRKNLVILVGFISVIISATYIFTSEYLEKIRKEDEQRYARIMYIMKGLNIFKSLDEDQVSDKAE